MRRKKITDRCCATFTNRRYRYCPYCTEPLTWPETYREARIRKRREREHEKLMKTDPEYRAQKEADERLVRMWMEKMLKDYESGDPFLGLTGLPDHTKPRTQPDCGVGV